jgi:hypothetical protein
MMGSLGQWIVAGAARMRLLWCGRVV